MRVLGRYHAALLLLLLFSGCDLFHWGIHERGKIQLTFDGEGVPTVHIDYTMDVRDFWDQHPANPESENYIPSPAVIHPEPYISVADDHSSSLDDAVQAVMDAGGGTLFFKAGTYNLNTRLHLYDTNNVHFVGAGRDKVTIEAATAESKLIILRSSGDGTPDVIESYEDPNALSNQVRNFYFEGLTFDGKGVSKGLINFTAAQDIWFRDCHFTNIDGSVPAAHNSQVSSHAWSNNIWFATCHFSGSGNHAIILDGTHGSGLVNCTVDFQTYPSALEFWSNYDCSYKEPLGDPAVFEPEEIRMGRYIVVDNCDLGLAADNSAMGISLKAGDVLIRNNRMHSFGDYFVRWSCGYGDMELQRQAGLDYIYRNLYVLDNRVERANYFLKVDALSGFSAPSGGAETRIGGYTVSGNTAVSIIVEKVAEGGDPSLLDGPNVIAGNSWQ